MIYWISMFVFWIYCSLFFPTKVIGKKNLLKTKCIWACNHTTNHDVLILGTKAFCRFYALAKVELFKNKLMNWYLNKIGGIPVNRGKSDLNAIKKTLRVLKEKNKPVLIFPTGTRESSAEEIQNIKDGVAMFALKANAPIVPIVFVRSPKIFRRNRLVIGQPIDIAQFENEKPCKEVYDKINSIITAQMETMIEKYSYKKK